MYKAIFIILMMCNLNLAAQSEVSVWNMPMKDFVDSVAKNHPKITGGCTSLTSATLGISLEIMSLEISKGKKKKESEKASITSCIDELRKKMDSLKFDADYDLAIFNRVREPATKISKKEKDSLYYIALIRATESPLQACDHILRALEIIEDCFVFIDSRVFSDVGAGIYILKGSLDALLLIAYSNIKELKEEDQTLVKQGYLERKNFGAESYGRILNMVNQKLENPR